jgi:hypothetical protein
MFHCCMNGINVHRFVKTAFKVTAVNNLTPLTCIFFYVLLTVHLSTILYNDQLDAQFLYFIIRLSDSSTCFKQCHAYHQEVKLY